ncbi:LOW QUALITY PROTEIN: lysine-specific demethylase SE14-like [Dioscorea cayenensis subsp. rotundata]|uniref:LOW QUALITY PROTEIN: lysine-specific demethylase SE14-like n=1 Tax=Dioscorea cayennensis subsp. rotundata TaxID=55577 RepID=A0AB40C896_DIOCR|nr:LOW QUALITY PROTEIN: lysine-specific demethylase SE14-like [Dioscorea cayenensis subsp. rotundata]
MVSSDPPTITIPGWLETLPHAPVYRPTISDFSDPISFISRIEHEASRFGICKVIPPLPRASKSTTLQHLHSSLRIPFSTRCQELGSKKPSKTKQVWQSGDSYTIEQFEAKSKAFAKSQLHGLKEVTPLLVESLFWNAVAEKPITVEYANDVPGSAFAPRRKKRKREEGTPRSLSDSPWNLQGVARSPGSLTRFMPDDIPGVTSPMVYIGMLFSWFAWHVEDHELHSLNFLHMGAPKTWYAVPGEYAASLEEVVRVKGYGGNVDRLAAFMMLGEKTTLLLPEVLVEAGIPCCRLVQYPGEFVVTFPRAYHVGFSHGFTCGEAANFATPQWLKVAKEAAVRRTAMNHLPMLSHQQLLYMLTMSFISRVPRPVLSGVRSSRLRDREKERELLIKEAFLNDMMDENRKLHSLLEKESIPTVVLWEPELLPSASNVSQLNSSSTIHDTQLSVIDAEQGSDVNCKFKTMCDTVSGNRQLKEILCEETMGLTSIATHDISSGMTVKDVNTCCRSSNEETVGKMDDDDDEEEEEGGGGEEVLPFGLNVDSGTLACVACGVLGFPFMAIVQPELFSLSNDESYQKSEKSGWLKPCLPSYVQRTSKLGSADTKDSCLESEEQPNQESGPDSSSQLCGHIPAAECQGNACGSKLLKNVSQQSTSCVTKLVKVTCGRFGDADSEYIKARIFCLQHAIEIADLFRCKGGARILIICHSDYLKIKALAIAVAEEIGMQFNFKDFPIEDASATDLDLINFSIDGGEEHEDWTSKLGINLRYCIKVRKQSSSNQEPLPLSLSKLFADSPHLSVVSTLKWLSRKSRTPYKVVGKSYSKTHIVKDTVNDEALKVCQNHKRRPSFITAKHHGQHSKGQLEESHGSRGTKSVDDGNDHSRTSGFLLCKDNLELFCTDSLVTVPYSSPSDKRDVHVNSAVKGCERQQVLNSNEEASQTLFCDSVNSGFCQSSSDLSMFENAEAHQSGLVADAVPTGCKTGDFEESESEINIVVQEVESLEVLKEIIVAEDSYPLKFGRTQAPANKPTPETETIAHEKLEGDDLVHNTGLESSILKFALKVDQSIPQLVSHNNSVPLENLEVSASELVNAELDVCSKLNNNESDIDDSQPQQNHILGSKESSLQCNGEDQNRQLGCEYVIDKPELQQNIKASADPEINGSMASEAETSEIPLDASNVDCINLLQDISVKLPHSVGRAKGLVMPQLSNGIIDVNSVPEDVSVQNGVIRNNVRPIIVYKRAERPKKKQKSEAEPMSNVHLSSNEFIRSPCEGLRPRTGRRSLDETADVGAAEKGEGYKTKKRDRPAGQSIIQKAEGTYICDIDGCLISFRTKRELDRHRDNRCIFKGCGKMFSSHALAMRHQRAHEDERPLKCPWKGCGMSFKWAWARTEHVRLHTGERPYKCKVAGCGLTFRFVSDFSRHRRKTGHSGNSKT